MEPLDCPPWVGPPAVDELLPLWPWLPGGLPGLLCGELLPELLDEDELLEELLEELLDEELLLDGLLDGEELLGGLEGGLLEGDEGLELGVDGGCGVVGLLALGHPARSAQAHATAASPSGRCNL